MSVIRYRDMLFVLTIAYGFAIFIFLSGFLSVSFLDGNLWISQPERLELVSAKSDNVQDIEDQSVVGKIAYGAHLDKAVIFLIDALRVDFITGNTSGFASLRNHLRDGNAKGFIAKARTPTVTLPRLKVTFFFRS